jgi:mannose-6-phosphate isomerase-like protein (cupin superfamily)
MTGYRISQLDELAPVRCPCGFTRRAFLVPGNETATVHLLDVEEDAQVHYHQKLSEIYLILEGEGYMELDGEQVPVRPMSVVMIEPGCRHRAVGKLRVALVAIPAFDPQDEWFDQEGAG